MKPLLPLVFCGVFFCLSAAAYITDDEDPFAGKTEFLGLKLDQFGDFAKKWRLVTVRFRKDSGEMRFTYANPAAWKSLAKNSSDYPDGAIFAKISIGTEPDPAFESSAVPSGAKRVQFMVRDKKKYQETDGWGYALFKGDGTTFPGDPKPAVIACHACHRLVPERGFVFSLPSTFDGFGTIDTCINIYS